MAAGSIVIDLLMKTGAFQTDTERAAKALKKLHADAEKAGKVIGTAIAGGAIAAAVAFDQLVKSAADFKDLEETIGSSAEDIASLSIAAATAGVSMESVTSATIKLTKGLVGVDDESKAAGAALAALGISVEDFKRLDPVGQYEAVGKALAGFADGAGKTAVAVALFGKSGAEQLKVFKALEEQGGRQVILTQKQIELADAYADAQAKQIATFKAYAQVAAVDLLPALNDLVEAGVELFRAFSGIDEAGKKLTGDSGIKEFAEGAINALAFIVDAGQGVVRIFEAIGKAIGGSAAIIAETAKGNLRLAQDLDRQLQSELQGILTAELFSQRLERIRARNANLAKLAQDPETMRLAARSRAAGALPEIKYQGPAKAEKDKTTEADKYLDKLREQVEKVRDLSEVEKLLADIQAGKFKDAKDGQIAQAIRLADELDGAKKLSDENKKLIDEAEQLEEASKRLRDETSRIFDDTRTPSEQYAIQLERLNYLLEIGALKSDVYARAVEKLQDQFDENVQRQKSIAVDINQSIEGAFANTFEGLITGTMTAKDAFRSFANSVIQDLARIASQQLAKDLFGGGKDGTGGIGGFLSKLFNNTGSSGGTGFGTGSNFGNQDYGAYLATGTNYVPHDGFKATLHKGEAVVPAKYNPTAGARQGTKVEVINPPGMPMQAQAREETAPDGSRTIKLLLSAVAADIASGGQIAKAQENRYGSRPNLARRG